MKKGKREQFEVTMLVSAPAGMMVTRTKLEIQTRINQLCGWGSRYGAAGDEPGVFRYLPETSDRGGLRAMRVKVRRAK